MTWKHKGYPDPTTMEVEAVLNAFNVAIIMEIRRLEVQTDCKEIMVKVNNIGDGSRLERDITRKVYL